MFDRGQRQDTDHVTESIHPQGVRVNTHVSLEIVLLNLGKIGLPDGSAIQQMTRSGGDTRG